MGCGGGSNTTTTTQQPNPVFQAAYSSLLNQAQNLTSQPLQQYTGQIVAPLNAEQTSAVNTIDNSQNIANPYLSQAQTDLQNATGNLWSGVQQFSPDAVSQYESPYQNQVIGATEAQMANQNAQQFNQAAGAASAAGAFGGDRYSVLQSQLGGQQALADSSTIAGLENQGYTTALGEFNTQQQNQLSANEANDYLNTQAGFGEMNLGTEEQNSALTGANAQLQAGTLEQQQAQENLNVPYEEFLQEQAYPYQNLSFLGGLTEGVGSESGGTSTTTTPQPSLLSQLGGIGLAAASFLERGGHVKARNNILPFRKRDAGGMIPYDQIGVSGDVPNLDISYVPSASNSSPHSSTIPRPPNPITQQAGLTIPQGMQIARNNSNNSNPLANVAVTPNQVTGTGGSGGILGTGESNWGSAIGDLGSSGLSWLDNLKRGGPIRRDAGGMMPSANDDDIEPVYMTQKAVGMAPTAADNFGLTPPTPITMNPQKPDWHNALLAAGLAIAGGSSPNALQNIGRGGLQGLQEWNNEKKQNEDIATKQANVGFENQRSQMSFDDARLKASQLADDLDDRRVQQANQQSNADRSFYQTSKNEDAQRSLQQQNMAAENSYRNADLGLKEKALSQTGSLDPSTVDYVAQQYALTGQMPNLGMGAAGAAMRSQIMTRAAQLANQNGTTGADAVATHAGTKADTQALGQVAKNSNLVQAFENTALQNANLALGLMDKGSGSTNIPIINAWTRAGGKALGDPDVSKFDTAVTTFKNEYAKIMSGATGGQGSTDSARHEADQLINPNMSREQIVANIGVMRQEMANRKNALIQQQQSLLKGIGGIGSAAIDAEGNPTTNAPKIAIPTAAVDMLKKNPQTRGHFDATFCVGSSASILGQ